MQLWTFWRCLNWVASVFIALSNLDYIRIIPWSYWNHSFYFISHSTVIWLIMLCGRYWYSAILRFVLTVFVPIGGWFLSNKCVANLYLHSWRHTCSTTHPYVFKCTTFRVRESNQIILYIGAIRWNICTVLVNTSWYLDALCFMKSLDFLQD